MLGRDKDDVLDVGGGKPRSHGPQGVLRSLEDGKPVAEVEQESKPGVLDPPGQVGELGAGEFLVVLQGDRDPRPLGGRQGGAQVAFGRGREPASSRPSESPNGTSTDHAGIRRARDLLSDI